MAKAKLSIDDLMLMGTRAEVRAAVAGSRMRLALPDAQKITARLQGIDDTSRPLRLAVVHTYTSELLDPWFALEAALQGLDLQTYHAPYGMTIQEAQAGSALLEHKPDLTLLLLRREDLHPDLNKPIARFDPAQQDELRGDVLKSLSRIVGRFRDHAVGQVVVSLLPSLQGPGLGVFDAQSDRSDSIWWSRLKADIGAFLRESVQSSTFMDLDEVLLQIGRATFFDARLWYSARFPFTAEAAREITRRVVAIGAVIKSPKAKVIVLDADNTLWGGIIGEDGMDGIALGPDYPGNAYVDFQRRILDYQQRGFILAMCSKNNPGDVDEVLKQHPHMVLRDEHFAARRVNWLPKPDNLVSLAEELNLGLDSFIFVDDSDHECAAVRQRLPQVEVIQTPARPLEVPHCLEQVARLEVLSLTAEDLVKTEMYAQERRRREMKEEVEKSGSGLADYLASLDMKMLVSLNKQAHLARLSQMTLKTNQFNLTTRRYDEQQMQVMLAGAETLVADFALTDIFGNSGVAGMAVFRLSDAQHAELDTFLMSCRVIGRDAEAAFLHVLLRHLAAQGVVEVVADFLPTKKNDLSKTFLADQGFVLRDDGRYVWPLRDKAPQPESAFKIQMTVGNIISALVHRYIRGPVVWRAGPGFPSDPSHQGHLS